jgi:UvrD-like helicase family protein
MDALTRAGLPFQQRSHDRSADRPGVQRILGELAYAPAAGRTLHAAKGLEFPVVFVVGCEDGLLPLRWPGTAPEDVDGEHVREERRLLFVGMTRAQRHLYLSHAAERVRHGATRKTTRSPFLADLDPAGYEQLSDIQPRQKPRDTQPRLL